MTSSCNVFIPLSVLVFTLNEEQNLSACLESVKFTDDVVVVDSFSTDGTLEIAKSFNTRIFQNEFVGFGAQRNWALQNIDLKYEWVLILDADERVSDLLMLEMAGVLRNVDDSVSAFMVSRKFHMWGRWLKHSSLYPTYVVRLVRKSKVNYLDRGHAEGQEVDGAVCTLESDLIDENRKDIQAWFARQNDYSMRDAQYELERSVAPFFTSSLVSPDPMVRRASLKRIARRLPGRPIWYFVYSYIVRGGFLDGRDGFYFCAMRAIYEGMVAVKKYDLRKKT